MFDVIEIDQFGNRILPQSAIVANGGRTWAVEIDPASEIDAVWLQMPGSRSSGGLMDARTGGVYGNGLTAGTPPGAGVLVSVDHPLVGPVDGIITALPYYRWTDIATGGVVNSIGSMGNGKLSLRVWKQEPPQGAIGTTKRAPLRAGWRSAGMSPFIIIPTFGRKLLRAFARSAAGGNLLVDFGSCVPGAAPAATNTFFQTGAPIVVGAGAVGAAFGTGMLPQWITFYGDGATTIDFLAVDVYD